MSPTTWEAHYSPCGFALGLWLTSQVVGDTTMTSILVSIPITTCFHLYISRSGRLNRCKCYQNVCILCIMVGARHPNAHDMENRRMPFPCYIFLCPINLPINRCSIGPVTWSAQEQYFAIHITRSNNTVGIICKRNEKRKATHPATRSTLRARNLCIVWGVWNSPVRHKEV